MKAARTPAVVKGLRRSELAAALASCRGAFISIAFVSAMSNILMLTGPLFMLEVYDRVLPSRSVPTLVGLTFLAGSLFLALALLDVIRGRILVRIGTSLDETLSGRVYDVLVQMPIKLGSRGDSGQPLRDLDSIRSFLSGFGAISLFDLPWIPVYLGICFFFHPLIGWTALIGTGLLVALTVLTEFLTRAPSISAARFASFRAGLAETSRRNAEALLAMGMLGRSAHRWSEANRNYLATQQLASDVSGGFGSVARVSRMMLQSAVIGVGAYLVIHQEATAGIIIAGSILAARALAPVDLAIAHWKGLVAARQSWHRLRDLLALLPVRTAPMALQPPAKSLIVEHASAVPPGGQKVIVQDISLSLQSGNGLGIIGPSGSGKSSLARLLVGVWAPAAGKIRLDGAALDQWAPDALGRHIGYLPQDVELLAGTIAENIGRFDPSAEPEKIIAAAKAAGIHEMVVGLPEGYETEIGEQGAALSAGQAQRVALARALYGDPFLVVLDEPNSNLDAEGDQALTRAIFGVRARGGIVVVIAHRPSAIAAVDLLLTMQQGRAQVFGPKDEVLAKVLQRETPPRPLKVVPEPGSAKS